MQVYNCCAHLNLRARKVDTARFANRKSHIYFVTLVDSHSRAWLASVLRANLVYSFYYLPSKIAHSLASTLTYSIII
jgi:hypothetical protein